MIISEEKTKEIIDTNAGKEYSWLELIKMLVMLEELEEKKYPWWKRHTIERYSFSCGLSVGMLYGVKMLGNDLKNKTEYSIRSKK